MSTKTMAHESRVDSSQFGFDLHDHATPSSLLERRENAASFQQRIENTTVLLSLNDEHSQCLEHDGGDKILVNIDDQDKYMVWSEEGEKIAVWDAEGDKQLVLSEDGSKQVCNAEEKEVCETTAQTALPDDSSELVLPRRILGIRKPVFCVIFCLFILLGLGIGLGVGVERKHRAVSDPIKASSSSDYEIGGGIDARYYSKSGAFNGSGIALISDPNLVLYFQHYTGSIRMMRLTDDGSWAGGDASTVMIDDARNSTPLSAVHYVYDGVAFINLFYVDTNDLVCQKIFTNATYLWTNGPLNALNLTAFEADQLGMQGCWWGDASGPAMKIWYATDNQTLQQIGWQNGNTSWTFETTWSNKNGHAGIGCYTWNAASTVQNVTMVNLDDAVEIWWKDSNSNVSSNPNSPIEDWTQDSYVTIPGVHPSTSLCYIDLLYAQIDDSFVGFNVTWDNGSPSIHSNSSLAVSAGSIPNPLPGSRLGCTGSWTSSSYVSVFYQVNGTNITQLERNVNEGDWTAVTLPIPD